MRELDKIHKPIHHLNKDEKEKASKEFKDKLAKFVVNLLEVRGIL